MVPEDGSDGYTILWMLISILIDKPDRCNKWFEWVIKITLLRLKPMMYITRLSFNIQSSQQNALKMCDIFLWKVAREFLFCCKWSFVYGNRRTHCIITETPTEYNVAYSSGDGAAITSETHAWQDVHLKARCEWRWSERRVCVWDAGWFNVVEAYGYLPWCVYTRGAADSTDGAQNVRQSRYLFFSISWFSL